MNKKQVFELLQTIQENYKLFEITQKTVDVWHEVLKDCEFNNIKQNLLAYVRFNKYPPVLSDLLQEPVVQSDRAILNVEETQQLLQSYNHGQGASDEVRERELAKMREILGIRR